MTKEKHKNMKKSMVRVCREIDSSKQPPIEKSLMTNASCEAR